MKINKYTSMDYAEYRQRIKNKKRVIKQNKVRKPITSATNVYIMLNKRNGLYKIGQSINPTYRERTLQAEEPEIELVFSISALGSKEKELHKIYATQRVRGEWFRLTADEVAQIISNLVP